MSVTGSCHCGKTAFRMPAEIPVELTRWAIQRCSQGISLQPDGSEAVGSVQGAGGTVMSWWNI